MEGANEAGRRAVNAILHAARSGATDCGVWPLELPGFLEVVKDIDCALYKAGKAHEGINIEMKVEGALGNALERLKARLHR